MSDGPILPVIYENPRFDTATPTLKPVFDRAMRFGLTLMLEWGTLTAIEDAPKYLKYATVIIAVVGLAVHESWPWLSLRDRRWYPALMIILLSAYVGIFAYALITEPSHKTAITEPSRKIAQPDTYDENKQLYANLISVTSERDALRNQLNALPPSPPIPEQSRYLHLTDARRWQVMKAMQDSMPGGCLVSQAFENNESPDRKSIIIWGEIQQPIYYAGWRFTQTNRSFFSPGISIVTGATSGHTHDCAVHLKDLLDGFSIRPVTLRVDESAPAITSCNNECIEVSVGKLETP